MYCNRNHIIRCYRFVKTNLCMYNYIGRCDFRKLTKLHVEIHSSPGFMPSTLNNTRTGIRHPVLLNCLIINIALGSFLCNNRIQNYRPRTGIFRQPGSWEIIRQCIYSVCTFQYHAYITAVLAGIVNHKRCGHRKNDVTSISII